MFDFFVDNQVVLDEIAYILCGIICIMTGIRARFNKEAKIGTMFFLDITWSIICWWWILG